MKNIYKFQICHNQEDTVQHVFKKGDKWVIGDYQNINLKLKATKESKDTKIKGISLFKNYMKNQPEKYNIVIYHNFNFKLLNLLLKN